MKSKTIIMSISMPADFADTLKRAAKAEGYTLSGYLRKLHTAAQTPADTRIIL